MKFYNYSFLFAEELSSEHVNKMKALEMAKEGERRMKEAALAQKLEHDLQQYREHGIIESESELKKNNNNKKKKKKLKLEHDLQQYREHGIIE